VRTGKKLSGKVFHISPFPKIFAAKEQTSFALSQFFLPEDKRQGQPG
jgi:hypothetical protein